MLKAIVHFKARGMEWDIGVSVQFNGHADDKKAVRKAVMEDVGKRWPEAKGFVQNILVLTLKNERN